MPFLHSINSDHYGAYQTLCVGIVDYGRLLRTMGVSEYERWYWCYGPVKYFRNFTYITLYEYLDNNGKSLHLDRVAIFVPTKEANKEWDSRNTAYGHAIGDKRKRPFPMSTSIKDIEKWQASLPAGILMPEWIKECSTLEELRIAERKAYS